MKKKLLTAAFLIAGAAWLAIGTPASANLTPTFVGVSADGANWDYTYDISLDNLQEIVPAPATTDTRGLVTIYDFLGFVKVVTTPGSWSSSSSGTGVDVLNVTPDFADNPGIPNVTIIYTGAGQTGPHDFGDLVIQSSIGPKTKFISFAAQAVNIATGLRSKNGSFTEGPAAVPLPAASWMGLALMGALGALKIRRSRAEA